MTLRQKVVFPEDSGPYISTILPLGKPPAPKAKSIARDPDEMTDTFILVASPKRIKAPSPNFLFIPWNASSRSGLVLGKVGGDFLGIRIDSVYFAIYQCLIKHDFMPLYLFVITYSSIADWLKVYE